MLNVSEIAAKTEAMFDSLTPRKIKTCNFSTQE